MRFPLYPKYSSSGVEWLGDVPEHWEVKRGRYCMRVNPRSDRLRQLGPEDEVSFVPMEAVGEYGGLNLDVTRPRGEVGASYTEFQDGDVIVAKITPCFENGKGALADRLTNGVALGTTELHVLRAFPDLERRFLFYLTISSVYRKTGEAEMYGAGGQKRVPPEFNLNFRTALPPLVEQLGIANFLDAETAKMGTLVAKRRELIEKLKEKRSALISRTVTRGLPPEAAHAAGLNPNPKLKPSGIEWLGEIPEHWEVRRLKFYLVRMEQGWSPQCENIPALGEEWGVLKVGAVNGAEFNPTENKRLPEGEEILPEYEIRVGDFLISRANTRELLGGAAIVRTLESRLLLCDKLYRLKLKTEALSPDFLLFFIRSIAGHFEFEREATGASDSMQNISQSAVRNLWVTVPPAPEQRAIADFLDRETLKIDRMVAKVEEAIERLQEYRTALITAAVTGKIDVRNVRHSGENRNPGDVEAGHRPSPV